MNKIVAVLMGGEIWRTHMWSRWDIVVEDCFKNQDIDRFFTQEGESDGYAVQGCPLQVASKFSEKYSEYEFNPDLDVVIRCQVKAANAGLAPIIRRVVLAEDYDVNYIIMDRLSGSNFQDKFAESMDKKSKFLLFLGVIEKLKGLHRLGVAHNGLSSRT